MVERFKTDRFDREEQDLREDDSYAPRGRLDIPQEIKDKFYDEGFKIKWVRGFIKGAVDTQNLRRRLAKNEGYSFVRPSDLDGDFISELGDTMALPDFGDVIVIGDVVLMKVRIAKNEARKDYYRGKTAQRAKANHQMMVENNRLFDTSSNQTFRGKRPQ